VSEGKQIAPDTVDVSFGEDQGGVNVHILQSNLLVGLYYGECLFCSLNSAFVLSQEKLGIGLEPE